MANAPKTPVRAPQPSKAPKLPSSLANRSGRPAQPRRAASKGR